MNVPVSLAAVVAVFSAYDARVSTGTPPTVKMNTTIDLGDNT